MFIGDQLTELRKGAGMTQDELARRSGISRPTIALIESGQASNPTLATMSSLAVALGVPVSRLVETPAAEGVRR